MSRRKEHSIMLKKLLILFFILAAAAVFAVSLFSKRAPGLLRDAISRALDKDVSIGSIEYHFPAVFELENFEIKEKAPFQGETSFYVDYLRLEVSPLSLSKKKLIIDKVEVENANFVIRKWHGRLLHALSDAMKKLNKSKVPQNDAAHLPKTSSAASLPLEIHQFTVRKSHFKFVDYDVQEGGFVVALSPVDAGIKEIAFPFSSNKTSYDTYANLPQGRDERPAVIKLSGWTEFLTFDTDANFSAQGVFLPYFKPYYGQVTPAAIENGFLDAHANFRLSDKNLVMNLDLMISNLFFRAYETENELFGLKADEILSFLKDRSGQLHFPIVARWNIADRSVRARDVIRKSIERSLKNMILGNIGNVLENTIRKIGDKGFDQGGKDDLEGVAKKIKDIFR